MPINQKLMRRLVEKYGEKRGKSIYYALEQKRRSARKRKISGRKNKPAKVRKNKGRKRK